MLEALRGSSTTPFQLPVGHHSGSAFILARIAEQDVSFGTDFIALSFAMIFFNVMESATEEAVSRNIPDTLEDTYL